MTEHKFTTRIWLYQGHAAWHFVSLPVVMSKEIKDYFGDMARGWGSLPVKVKLGETSWRTSIFPDSKTNTYVLPIKSAVRKQEKLQTGDKVQVVVEIIT